MSLSTLRVGRRRSAILPTLVIVAILIVVFAIFTSVWTDRLWYGSFGFASVFSKMLLTRIGLFVSFGLITTLVVANAAIAYRLRHGWEQVPSSPLLERYREMLESRFVWVLVAIGVVVGLFAGGAASGHVLSTSSGKTRPCSTSPFRTGLTSGSSFSHIRGGGSSCRSSSLHSSSAIAAAIVHYTMGGLRFSGHVAAEAGRPRLTSRSWSVWPCW